MPKYTDLPAVIALDGTEILAVIVDPDGDPIAKKATTAQVAALGSGAAPVTTLAGSVSGSAYCTQTSNLAGYKRVVVTLVNYQSTAQDFIFPTAFASVAVDVENSSPPGTVILTKVTLPDTSAGPAVNAVIIIEGR